MTSEQLTDSGNENLPFVAKNALTAKVSDASTFIRRCARHLLPVLVAHGYPMEAGHIEPPAPTSQEPNPLCPFESGARLDKVNFPDVLLVLPLRGVAGSDGTPVGRRAGDDLAEDNTAFALEAMDVEERRARDLADCTVEVTANTSPCDIDVPENCDGDALDVSSEDELALAMRVGADAAKEADEMRCQTYFDEKEVAARVSGGRDPALCSPLWEVDSPVPADERGSPAVSASPMSSSYSPSRYAGSPGDSWSPTLEQHDNNSPNARHQSKLPLTPPRRRPFGRGTQRTRARVFQSVEEGDEGDENVVPDENADTVAQLIEMTPRSVRVTQHVGEDSQNRNSFDSVKNGLYALFCREAGTPARTLEANTKDCDFAGISPIPTIHGAKSPGITSCPLESPETRQNGLRRVNVRRRSLFDVDDCAGVAAAIAAIANDASVSLENSFEFDSPDATPVPHATHPPRLTKRGGTNKTRTRTGLEETSPDASSARIAVRLDLVEFANVAVASSPPTPPLRRHEGNTCTTCGRGPPGRNTRRSISPLELSIDALRVASPGMSSVSSPASVQTERVGGYGGSDADISAAEDDDSAHIDDFKDVSEFEKESTRASARRRHRIRTRRSECQSSKTQSKFEHEKRFFEKLEDAVKARRPPLTPTELAVRGLTHSTSKFNTPTMPFSVSMSMDKPNALANDVDTALRSFAPGFRNSHAKVLEETRVLDKNLSMTHNASNAFLDDSATRGGVNDSQWGACDGPIHRALATSFSELKETAAKVEKLAHRGRRLDFDGNENIVKHDNPYAFIAEIRRIVNASVR